MANTRLPQRLLHQRVPAVFLFPVFLLCLFLTGCLHVQLIGDYDETIDKGITDVQLKAEIYLSKLKSTPDTPYDSSFYDDINAHLATLKTRATVTPQSSILTEEIVNLRSEFDKLQEVDSKARRPIPPIIPSAAENAISSSVESILRLEIALKRSGKSAPALTATGK